MRDLVARTSAIVQNARRRIGVAQQHFHRLIREAAEPVVSQRLALPSRSCEIGGDISSRT